MDTIKLFGKETKAGELVMSFSVTRCLAYLGVESMRSMHITDTVRFSISQQKLNQFKGKAL